MLIYVFHKRYPSIISIESLIVNKWHSIPWGIQGIIRTGGVRVKSNAINREHEQASLCHILATFYLPALPVLQRVQ